jgi:isopentenyl-diphosphate delta-isomerase
LPPDGTPRLAPIASDGAIMIPGIAPDGSLYPIEKIAAHRDGALHLAVSVFVFSGDRLLIQRRAEGKYHSAGLWANTCCTHPHWDEPPTLSAARRLQEELGIVLPLAPTTVIDYEADVSEDMREHERVHIYRGDAGNGVLRLAPNIAEVSATAWVEVARLREDAVRRPSTYAPWFRIYLERWPELGL